MANGWTSERRKKHAEMIKSWQPWNKSTGPQSVEGKAIAARNAFKGGWRQRLREISVFLREQQKNLGDFK